MSKEEPIRQVVRERMQDAPQLNKVETGPSISYWEQQVVNSEIDNQRRRDEERRQRGS